MKPEVKQLIKALSEIFKAIHQHSYHKMKDKCLYPGQPQLLSLIKANEGITQKDLSEKNFVKPATITGMLNKLEANHYVYRVADEADKRVMRVYLTPEGRHITKQGEKFMESLTDQLFDGFSDEELQTFVQLIQKMRTNLHHFEK
jgi:DNA-binding MarR family transcriptional regulator